MVLVVVVDGVVVVVDLNLGRNLWVLNLANGELSVVAVVVMVVVMYVGLVNGAGVDVVEGRTVIRIGFVVVDMVVVEAVVVVVGVVEDLINLVVVPIVVVDVVVVVVDLNLGLNL